MPHPRQFNRQVLAGDQGGGPMSQELVNALYEIFGDYPRMNVLPYFYQFSLTAAAGTALAALGTRNPSIKVSADAAFVVKAFAGSSTADYLMSLRTDSSDRQLTDAPAHSSTLVGTAERPGYLAKPLLMAPNTTMSFQLTDLSGAQNEVYFTMIGFKVYQNQYASGG
jgi:hypothetical protein